MLKIIKFGWTWSSTSSHQFLNKVHHETTGFTPNKRQTGEKDVRFCKKLVNNFFISVSLAQWLSHQTLAHEARGSYPHYLLGYFYIFTIHHDDNISAIVTYMNGNHNEALSGSEKDEFGDSSVLWDDGYINCKFCKQIVSHYFCHSL